jgi:hypothetical protein
MSVISKRLGVVDADVDADVVADADVDEALDECLGAGGRHDERLSWHASAGITNSSFRMGLFVFSVLNRTSKNGLPSLTWRRNPMTSLP